MNVIFKFENFLDDSISFSVDGDGRVLIEIDSPWSGDDEAGIGKNLTITLPINQAILLRNVLTDYLNKIEK